MNKTIGKREIKRVIFYTNSPRAFRTTLIGNLYETCQAYPTVLLSEKLDSETEIILQNKELFPKLENIVAVRQFTGEKKNLFSKNRCLFKLAKNIIQEHKPDIVISSSDTHSLFELYLTRFAKKAKALNISIQDTLVATESTQIARYIDLINVHLRFPNFLPLFIRLFLVKCRKYFGHFLYYWILPLIVGEMPFFGKSSYILRKGNSGMRDADYQIALSKRDYDILLKDGVPAEKLKILSHPLSRETKEFFEKVYFNQFKNQVKEKKVITLLLPEVELVFKRKDWSLISRKEIEKKWMETISLIKEILPDWDILIKPHPDFKNLPEIKKKLESISKNIKVTNPGEPVDKYIELADVVVGLPLSSSTALFTASLQCPEKPIISLDFHQEILGDVYKSFEGVEYVDNKKRFLDILKMVRENKYRKKQMINKTKPGLKEFSDTVEIIKYLFDKKNENI